MKLWTHISMVWDRTFGLVQSLPVRSLRSMDKTKKIKSTERKMNSEVIYEKKSMR